MARLIDADALKAIRFHDFPYSQIVPADCDTDEKVSAYKLGWNDAIDAIVESVPTVDPVKHGHWVKSNSDYEWECSSCGYGYTDYKITYCYDCGAKMNEVEE